MNAEVTFGQLVKARRRELGLTQDELAHRVGCAPVTLRKIEYDDLRPSVQIAERLAMALGIPLEERATFVRLARVERAQFVEPPPTPPPALEEIGMEDLSGRAIRGYALGDRIGNGGFGAVYRATQPLVEREVAIKIILPKYANHPEFIRRFEAEAQLVARLEHPHVVPLYDYWREPNVAYLVMRLLRGGSVQSLLQSGPLQPKLTLRILEQIGSALAAAHRAGVIHRDLKPANVLLDDEQNAYLADFGIAKNLSSPLPAETQVDAIVGTPDYISPEQIRSEFVRPQTDIYCLGVMMYELLTGTVPFRGPTPIEIMHQHLTAPMPPLAANRGGLPKALDDVIERATAKDPFERYTNVENLIADFRHAIGVEWQISTSETATIISPPVVSLTAADNPYKGLRAFNEFDAADFFGRETLTQGLLARLGEGGDLARFLAVAGPSGSGKSSVVKAGLIPALRRGGLPGSENWFIIEMMPGTNPFEELEAALLRMAVNPPSSLLDQLREDKRGLLRAVNRCLPDDPAVELVLVIDQFEELFTLVQEEALRVHLLESLVTAALDERSRVRIVITLRADFVDRPLNYVDFGDLLRQRTEFVLPLTPDELERAILSPAERVGLQLESGVVSAIVHDLGNQAGTLPLLQYALTELFEKRKGNIITKNAYQSIGGVLGALGRRAEEVFMGLSKASQNIARQLFLRMVTLGDGVEDTRRRVLRSELQSLARQENEKNLAGVKEVNAVLNTLGKSRLLTFDRDPLTRTPTVEVAHEALLREWSRLREWLNESRADVRLQRQLSHAATEWQAEKCDASYLLTGARLAQFENWMATSAVALSQDERAFLQVSIEERERREMDEAARQQRELEAARKLVETEHQSASRLRIRNRAITIVGTIAVILAVLAGTFGVQSNNNAETAQNNAATAQVAKDNALNAQSTAVAESQIRATQQAVAEANFNRAEAQRLAVEANGLLLQDGNAETIALLAIRSMNTQYTAQGDEALVAASLLDYPNQEFLGHTDRVKAVDFSPDGRYVLTGSADSTVLLWDRQTGQLVRQFSGDMQDVNSAVFSPDGRFILAGSRFDHTVRLWDVETGEEFRRFGEGNAGAFSLDGHRIFVFSEDNANSMMIDLQTGQILHTIPTPQQWRRPEFTGYSPDGTLYADIPLDEGNVHIREVSSGREILSVPIVLPTFEAFAFSSDNYYFAVTNEYGSIQLWDLRTAELSQTFSSASRTISLAFSPDNRLIASGDAEAIVRLWDVMSGEQIRRFRGHTLTVRTVRFSPDGRFVMSGGLDQKALIWQITPSAKLQLSNKENHDLYVSAYSRDGNYIAAGREDGTAVVWDADTGEVRETLQAGSEEVWPAGFTPDNSLLVTTSDGVRVWDTKDGVMLREFNSGSAIGADFNSLAISSKFILAAYDAIGDWTGGVIAWDMQTGAEVQRFTVPSGAQDVAISPDEKLIATWTIADYQARVFDVETGMEIHVFSMENNFAPALAFSPDSRILFTGGNVISTLWDLRSGKQLHQIVGPRDAIISSAFSHDGRYVVTASANDTMDIWDSQTGQAVRHITLPFPPDFVSFSENDNFLFIQDGKAARLQILDVRVEDVITELCSRLLRDFTTQEREQYGIMDSIPTCP